MTLSFTAVAALSHTIMFSLYAASKFCVTLAEAPYPFLWEEAHSILHCHKLGWLRVGSAGAGAGIREAGDTTGQPQLLLSHRLDCSLLTGAKWVLPLFFTAIYIYI